MFDFFKSKPKDPCAKGHDYATVAFDASFSTTWNKGHETERVENHHLRWKKCKHCGHRSFDKDGAARHTGVTKVENNWIERNSVVGTSDLDVYDDDYTCVSLDSNTGWQVWKYKQLTGVEKLLKQLKEDGEFKELLKNQMVEDAFGELETVIQMHKNL